MGVGLKAERFSLFKTGLLKDLRITKDHTSAIDEGIGSDPSLQK